MRIPRRLAGIGATDLPNAAAFDSYIGPTREVTVDPDRGIVALHDGVTPGGRRPSPYGTVFPTLAALMNARALTVGNLARTGGYNSYGDFGANDYEIVGDRTSLPAVGPGQPYVVIGSGQSNMVGLSPTIDGVFPSNSNVFMWLGTTDDDVPTWVQNPRLDTTTYRIPVGLTLRPTIGGGQNNLALAFAHKLQLVTGKPVYVIVDARGSQSIDNWIVSGVNSARYQSLLIEMAAAWPGIPGSPTKAQFFLWHQGETDALAGDSAATHKANLETLYSQLSAETWWSAQTVFVAGKCAQATSHFVEVNNALDQFAAVNPARRKVANSIGLALESDNTHFTNFSLHTFGYYRYWDAVAGVGMHDGGSIIDLPNGLQARGLFPSGLVNPKQFGATTTTGDDDTPAWTAFQAFAGIKWVPPGAYRVNTIARAYDNGAMGNGAVETNLDGATASGISMGPANHSYREANIVFGTEHFDQNIRPAIYVSSRVVDDTNAGASARVAGIYAYLEQTGKQTNQYPKAIAGVAVNAAGGDNDATGIVGYAYKMNVPADAPNGVLAGVGDVAGAGGVAWQRSLQAGLVIGAEFACHMGVAPTYANGLSGTGNRTMCAHITTNSTGGAVWAGLSFDSNGLGAGSYGYYSAINFSRSAFGMGGEGVFADTVGINFGSNTTTGPEKAIYLGNAKYHLWRPSTLAIRIHAGSIDIVNPDTSATVRLVTPTATPQIRLFGGYKGTIGEDGTTSLTADGNFAIDSDSYVYMTAYRGSTSVFSRAGCSPIADAFIPMSSAGTGQMSLGVASRLWSQVFASTATINTSDERYKQDVEALPELVLDAWGEVGFQQYRFVDAVEDKGDGARLHSGVIAQRVVEAFADKGLDAADYGLLCYDEWEGTPEQEHIDRILVKHAVYERVLQRPATFSEDGEEIKPALYIDGDLLEPEEYEEIRTVTPAVPGGNRFGIRYEEALCLEAAFQRRRADRQEARLAALEAAVEALISAT